MFNFLLLLLSPLLTLGGIANPTAQTQQSAKPNYSYTAACFNPEPDQTITVTKEMLDEVHSQFPTQPRCDGPGLPGNVGDSGILGTYIRTRTNLRLIKLKTDQEGKPFYGGCAASGSAIRWVGNTPSGQKIWWEDKNHAGNVVSKMVFIEAYEEDDQARYFDAYVRQDVVADPAGNGYQFLLDCKVKGGLVPVVEEGSNILPPQVISFSEINMTGFEDNYNRFAIPINVTQKPGTIGPTLSPTYQLFPPYKKYLVKLENEDVPEDAIRKRGQIGRVVKTANGTSHIYDVFFHLGSFYIRDEGDGTSYIYDSSEDTPFGSINRNPSLQLGVLAFRLTNEYNPYTPVCKPAVYLYPEKPTTLSVEVRPEGYLTKTIPDYQGKWDVKAYPDGTLYDVKNPDKQVKIENNYLYYEADVQNVSIPKEGFVVKKDELQSFFATHLAKLGLNQKESADFKAYWVPKLTDKPYYFVTLLPEKEINSKEQLVFSLNPKTIIRVRFIFEGLDKPIDVKSLSLSSTPVRDGFTVVDWGGGIVNGNCDDISEK